jgi:hypothetical protein
MMEKRGDTRTVAVDRFEAAREDRDQLADRYDAARGSGQELPAFAELQAAEDRFAAREAWLKWVDRDY